MSSFRYTLETGSRRYTCPQCNQKGKFKRYIDNESGTYIADIVGRCDRENNCDYHLRPKEYFERYGTQTDQRKLSNTGKQPSPIRFNYPEITEATRINIHSIISIPELLRQSLNQYDRNNSVFIFVPLFW
jgi:hypothetical protein